MVNKKAKEVIARLEKEADENWNTIQILGDEENQVNAFGILMNSQRFSGTSKNLYHGITVKTINLLKEAEIDFKITER